MEPGQRVRIKTAPEKIGVLTSERQELAGRTRWRVQFPAESQWVPERNLELVEGTLTLVEQIDRGNFGGLSGLRMATIHALLTGRLADVIYSMEATNTEFFAYQFKPVLNFLESPSNGILIADEVGLGKTIEAGLIWTELRARVDADRLLIICPAVLRQKWASELSHRFGIRAQICAADELLTILQEEDKQPQGGFAIVASMQGLRPSKGWDAELDINTKSARLARYIQEKSTEKLLFDCVIIDEAHYLRNPEAQTHKLAQLIRPATGNIVLLSATPIQLRSEDLYHLLNIIDGENFEFKDAFDEVLAANQPLTRLAASLRNAKLNIEEFQENLESALSHRLLKNNRQLLEIRRNPPSDSDLFDVNFRVRLANRIERINLLGSIVSRTRKRDVQQNKVFREVNAPVIEMSRIEREFYEEVTDAVRRYCQQYDLFEGFMATIPQRQMCSSMPAALRAWMQKIDSHDDDLVFESFGLNSKLDNDTSGETGTARKKRKTGPLIDYLAQLSRTICDYEELKISDSKFSALVSLLRNYWEEYPSEKIVLFSFYRETLHYLHERLVEEGIANELLLGGMGDRKEETIERFRDPERAKILLSSEVLSEGVDLQFCGALINYDMPWNPMRVEQRIGRIDRIGQKKNQILIWNFFYSETIDDRIYTRLLERLNIFQSALGDIEAVLGDRVRRLTYDLLSHELTPEQEEERILQTAAALENEKQNQEKLEYEAAGLVAHGDYILNKVSAAKDLRRFVDGRNLWFYVRDFLNQQYPGNNLVEVDSEELEVEVDLSFSAKSELSHYLQSNRRAGYTQLATNPTGKPVRCVFHNHVDFGSRQQEVVNQSHPLVRFVAENVDPEKFHGLTAVELSQEALDFNLPSKGTYLILIKRWSTSGARVVERMVYSGVEADSGIAIADEDAERLVNACVMFAKDWGTVNAELEKDSIKANLDKLEMKLEDQFEEYHKAMELENEDQVDFRISALRRQVARQVRSRQDAIETLKLSGKTKMIALNEAMIKKLEQRLNQRIEDYERKRKISSEPRDVVAVVINVK